MNDQPSIITGIYPSMDPHDELNKPLFTFYKIATIVFAIYEFYDLFNALAIKNTIVFVMCIVMVVAGLVGSIMGFLSLTKKDAGKAKTALSLYFVHIITYLVMMTLWGLANNILGSLMLEMIIRTVVFAICILFGATKTNSVLQNAKA